MDDKFVSPWSTGLDPATGVWISPADAARVERWNSRLPLGDPRRVILVTSGGHPVMPGQWSGDPSSAPVVLLLLNPSYGPRTEDIYEGGPPEALYHLCLNAMGHWDATYPNPWLHPVLRSREPWCSSVVFGALHRQLQDDGWEAEAAWQRISQRVAVLELSPWPSHKWGDGAWVSTCQVSVDLARRAMSDPGRLALLGRGESEWKSAGLLDADVLPKSRGVRSHQCRLTRGNFPEAWDRLLSLVEDDHA